MTTSDALAAATTLTVLFVDDDPAVIRMISRVMATQAGYDVITATSAAEALGILRAWSIDILVSDIDMPEVSGLELVRLALRESPSTMRILLTGAATMDRALNAINEGEVVRFFTKPFEVERFVHAFGELRERILVLRRERQAEAERERSYQVFQWVEQQYPGTLTIERGDRGEVLIDVARLRAHLDSAAPEVRAFVYAR